jgi:hypothetical protein
MATVSCGNYVCGTNACLTTCTADTQCSSTSFYCTGSTGAPGSCVAKKANGATCTATKECASGNCVDGVCCSTSSCQACQSCNLNGLGTCSNVGLNLADPPNCAANPPCGNTGFCDGNGACQQTASSVSCGLAQSCTGTTYQPPSHCSGTGTCSQQSTSSCGNYVCSGTSCLTTCTADNQCSNTTSLYCTGSTGAPGTCASKKTNGTGCGAGKECMSGNCVDAVCCSTSSCQACQSCNLNGLGTCSNVGVNLADSPNCAANPPCGNTGFCDGNGNCQQAASTVSCGLAQSCTGTTYQPPSHCSGTGTCSQQSTNSCGNYNCSGSSCLISCTADTDCSSTNLYCTGSSGSPGSCTGKSSNGTACTAAHECQSNNCVDGYCCFSSSCGTCEACDVLGFRGTCHDQPDGDMERHNRCGPNGNCGNTGFCTGGACTQVAANTQCSGFFCQGPTDHVFQPGGSCNGIGTCVIPGAVDCGTYKCTTGNCFVQCNNDNQCVSTAYCTGNMTTPGSCVPKGSLGDTCTQDRECAAGSYCTEGVCCNVGACSQPCYSCRVPGLKGTCNPVPPGGFDPMNTCTDMTAASCGTNGRCDGSGSCQYYDTNTVCATSCNVLDLTRTRCGGPLMCNGVTTVDTCTLTCTLAGCDL